MRRHPPVMLISASRGKYARSLTINGAFGIPRGFFSSENTGLILDAIGGEISASVSTNGEEDIPAAIAGLTLNPPSP
jgi:hypothetical protein